MSAAEGTTESDDASSRVFEELYSGADRAEMFAAFKQQWRELPRDWLNSQHSLLVDSGQFEVVGTVSIRSDGAREIPVGDAVFDEGDRPFLVMVHERPNGDVVKTRLPESQVAWLRHELEHLFWLQDALGLER